MTTTMTPSPEASAGKAGSNGSSGSTPDRREPGAQAPRTPSTVTRMPAGKILARAPRTSAERRRWDRLHFQTELSRQWARSRRCRPAPPQLRSDMPDPRRHAARVVTAAAEVLSGHRPVDHLARWTTPEMFEALARRSGLSQRLPGSSASRTRPRARHIHTQFTLSGNCEVAVLLDDGPRVRAAAALLVPRRGRWVMSVLEIG